jgi:small GTP-binding protein
MIDRTAPDTAATFRVVLVGDSGVGKSAIVNYLIQRAFEPDQPPTVGAVFHTMTRVVRDQHISIQVWDTAGQEKFRSLGPVYYRNAVAALAVYDVTVDDFGAGLDQWIIDVKRTAHDVILFIVGNKCDLLEDTEEAVARGRQYAETVGATFFWTSAKSGVNIELLFDTVFESVAESVRGNMDTIENELRLEPAPRQECC